MNKTVYLNRVRPQEKQTLGGLHIYNNDVKDCSLVLSLYTLELPWRDNQRNVSCIPTGVYEAVPRVTSERGAHYHVLNVPNRTWILFHTGNYHWHIQGCILPGLRFSDINKDGLLDVVNSTKALEDMREALDFQPFTLVVT